MRVFMVFVRYRDSRYGISSRWLDSQWASAKAANERRADLGNSLTAFGCNSTDQGATVSIVEGKIEDAKLTEPAKP